MLTKFQRHLLTMLGGALTKFQRHLLTMLGGAALQRAGLTG